MHRLRAAALLAPLLAAALAAACGEADPFEPEPPPPLDGVWDGALGRGVDTLRFVLTLRSEDGEVEGTGEIRSEPGPGSELTADTLDLTVAGAQEALDVALRLSAPGHADALFTGRFGAERTDSVGGTLQGSGFAGASLSLLRRP